MIEIVVGAAGLVVISFLAGRVITLNWDVIGHKRQRDSAYRLVSKINTRLMAAEEYISKLEGGSSE